MRRAKLRCLIVAAITATSLLRAQQVDITHTTADLAQALAAETPARFAAHPPAASLVIVVDDSQRFQTIDGFGASLTDGAAWLLHDHLSAGQRQRVMETLFSPQRGVGLSFLRQPIGSTDLSRGPYTFDDLPAGEQDPDLLRFSAHHDDAYVFPLLRDALRLNPQLTLMATPWSPPAWMKTRSTTFGGQLSDDDLPVYADYLIRSVQAFASAGVPIQYLSVQNEPLYETKDYPGTLMTAEQQIRLIGQFLGPDLQRAGLATRILAYDHNWDHPEYPIAVASSPLAAPFVAGSAMHCYAGDVSAQDEIHRQVPDKGIWLTECSGGTWQTDAPLLATARLLIEATRDWARSVVLWGLATDSDHGPHAGGCGTCRGLITVDLHTTPTTVSYNGDFYALAQASRFVHPGATRIASTTFGRDSLESVAFQNPSGAIALLVLNSGKATAEFQVRWNARSFQATLQPGELATYRWPSRPLAAVPARAAALR